MTSPQVGWLFFKARAKRPYLDSYGSSEQRRKTANWPRPKGLRQDGRTGALSRNQRFTNCKMCGVKPSRVGESRFEQKMKSITEYVTFGRNIKR
jgi:hypothetical protein